MVLACHLGHLTDGPGMSFRSLNSLAFSSPVKGSTAHSASSYALTKPSLSPDPTMFSTWLSLIEPRRLSSLAALKQKRSSELYSEVTTHR